MFSPSSPFPRSQSSVGMPVVLSIEKNCSPGIGILTLLVASPVTPNYVPVLSNAIPAKPKPTLPTRVATPVAGSIVTRTLSLSPSIFNRA